MIHFVHYDLAHIERTLILLALHQSADMSGASKLLGLTRHALKRRIVKHEIDYPLPEDSTPPPLASRGPVKLKSLNLNEADRIATAAAVDWAGSLTEAAPMLGLTRHGVRRRVVKHKIEWVTTHSPHSPKEKS